MPSAFIVRAELFYPRVENNPDTVEIKLTDIRAADSIRVKYDFYRDGWVIFQASTFGWAENDTVMDSDWQEVAFVQAWARESEATRED